MGDFENFRALAACKLSIDADSRKNKSIFAAAISAAKKQRNFCAYATRQLHRNKWVQCTPTLPCHSKRSDQIAVLVAHESAEPSSQPVLLGLASAANDRTDSSNPIPIPKRSIH